MNVKTNLQFKRKLHTRVVKNLKRTVPKQSFSYDTLIFFCYQTFYVEQNFKKEKAVNMVRKVLYIICFERYRFYILKPNYGYYI